jgi:hypothetical protein
VRKLAQGLPVEELLTIFNQSSEFSAFATIDAFRLVHAFEKSY